MTTGRVVNLQNGHNGVCVEVLRGVTFCGTTFDPSTVEIEQFTVDESRGKNHRHSVFCFDCSKFDTSKLRRAARGVPA